MALAKNCNARLKRDISNTSNEGLEIVNFARSIRRKRVVVSNEIEELSLTSPFRTPSKKQLDARLISEKSNLEVLPQDILVRILCGVDHDDLIQLFHVSKSMREATLIAKRQHFSFSTPISKTVVLRPFSNLEDGRTFDNEAPNAPKQQRSHYKSKISRKKLAEISVALFHSPKEEEWRDDDGVRTETETS